MNFTYGYCRISTPKQNIERQVRNIIEKYPDAKIIQEKYSGAKADRPEWNKLLRLVKSGDTIVFDSVSRMSRNADDGVNTYFDLYERGINLVFLKEHYVDTDVYLDALSHQVPNTNDDIANIYIDAANKALKCSAKRQIRIAFEQAQKEVDDIHQRTAEGIETARRNGKQIGAVRGKKLTTKKSIEMKKVILKYNRAFSGGTYDDEATRAKCKTVGRGGKDSLISWTTYYKYKEELMDEHPELVVRRRKSTKRIMTDVSTNEVIN